MVPKISFLNAYDAFDLNKLMGMDAFVIDAQNSSFTRTTLKEIRSHSQRKIALAPVFLLNPKETNDPYIRNLNDGIVFSAHKLAEATIKIEQIHSRIAQLSSSAPLSFSEQILKRTLDYMHTRSIDTISPHVDHLSAIGYTWPELSVHFELLEESKVLEVLDFAKVNGSFSEQFVDKIHVCNGCHSGFLHLHEVCPGCNSKNIEMEDLVHHFPCAYVGPFSDFKKTEVDEWICPKCNKKLRHIGIDHDKPSVICRCNNCNKNFQDAFVVATCLYCKRQTEMEYLVARNICSYSITKKGKYIATSRSFIFNEVQLEGTSSFEFYQAFLSNQLAKIKNRIKTSSTAVLIRLDKMKDTYNRIGEEGQEQVISGITGVIREHIRSSDLISVENPFCIHVCLNDYAHTEIGSLIEKLLSRLSRLLKDNFNAADFELACSQKELSPQTSIEKLLLELNDDRHAVYS